MIDMDTSIFEQINVAPIRDVRFQNGKIPSALVDGKFYIVKTTGCLEKSGRDQTQPKISVSFKQVNLSTGETTGDQKCIKISAISGVLLRAGYVFQFVGNGKNLKVSFLRKYPRVKLNLNFHKSGWSIVKPEKDKEHFIPKNIYDISGSYDYFIKENPYIKFKVDDHPGIKNVYVSCFELFLRTYGSSDYIKRILLTHSFKSAYDRLFLDYDNPKYDTPGQWTLKPHSQCNRADVPLLGAMKYDTYTINKVSKIFNEIMASNKLVFPWIFPWFHHKGHMTFSGLKLPNEEFLGLRIDGFKGPEQAIKVVRVVKRYDDDNGELVYGGEENGGQSGPPKKKKTKGDDFGVEQDTPPGEDADTFEIDESPIETDQPLDIEYLDEVEIVPRPEHKGNANTNEIEEDKKGSISPGEPSNDPNQVDQAIFNTPLEFESKGTLWEIWNDFVNLHHMNPKIIKKIEHYNFLEGLSDNGKPKLIAFKNPSDIAQVDLERYDELDKAAGLSISEIKELGTLKKLLDTHKSAKNWVVLRGGDKRGLLVIKVSCNTMNFYCIESQREIKPDESSEQERFYGLFFTLYDDNDLKEVIENARMNLPKTNGRFTKTVRHKSMSYSDTYQHTRREEGDYFFGHALQKITNSLGIAVSIEVSVKPRLKKLGLHL